MSKAFITSVLQDKAGLSGTVANAAAGDVIAAIVAELKREGRFTLPGFGTFTVAKRKARTARSPRTGEPIKVKASKTVRFTTSLTLKRLV